MTYDYEVHCDMLILTPALGIACGEEIGPDDSEIVWRISLSWLFWTGCLFL